MGRLFAYDAHSSVCEERYMTSANGQFGRNRLLEAPSPTETASSHAAPDGGVGGGSSDVPMPPAEDDDEKPAAPLKIELSNVKTELPDELLCKICLTEEANAL